MYEGNWRAKKHAMNILPCTFCSILLLLLVVQSISSQGLENLRCLICKQIVNDLATELTRVDPKKKVEIGNYRLDANGNSQHNVVPYALTEMHISDSLEKVCKGMDDYVRARQKNDGELVLLKLIVDGKMNLDMSNVDIIQDGDLNKSLQYYCDGIVEEYEERIVPMVQNKEEMIEEKLCTEIARLCIPPPVKHDDL